MNIKSPPGSPGGLPNTSGDLRIDTEQDSGSGPHDFSWLDVCAATASLPEELKELAEVDEELADSDEIGEVVDAVEEEG